MKKINSFINPVTILSLYFLLGAIPVYAESVDISVGQENPVLSYRSGSTGYELEAKRKRELKQLELDQAEQEKTKKEINLAHACDTYKALQSSLKDKNIKFKIDAPIRGDKSANKVCE